MSNTKRLAAEAYLFWCIASDMRGRADGEMAMNDGPDDIDDELDTVAQSSDWPRLQMRIAEARSELHKPRPATAVQA